jgi:hypothetical protein
VAQYLAWLDRVEALGLTYVNANIVTHSLRLFYQSPRKSRRRTPEPTPRMKEVKDLLETVRHNEQSNLLLLRARRHTLEVDIQHLAGQRKSGSAAGPWGNSHGRGDGGHGGGWSLGWVQVVVLVAALLAGSLALDVVRPELVRLLRSWTGLDLSGAAVGGTGAAAGVDAATPPSGNPSNARQTRR